MCDSVVAAAPHTAAGRTLFAKNSDRHAGECQPLLQFPAALHPRGASVACTHIEIAEVAETYRVMGHSPWWVWGFEHGVNEHALAIGNQSVFSREAVEEAPGLIGMDLVRLGLERGRDAREALEVIATLIERHGQGGSGFGPGEGGYHNSFMLADPEAAWVMETSGRRWAARQVDLEALSNHMTLTSNWGIGSRDLESFARSHGWWRGRDRVDLAHAYRSPGVPGCISEGRLARSRELLRRARGKHDVAGMQALLRDHGPEGATPPEGRANDDPARYTLCMHAEPVGTTAASLIAPLPVDRTAPWPVWISFGSPCLGVFMPVDLDGLLPAALARGRENDPALASDATQEEESAWWAFHRLAEAAASDLPHAIPRLREGWRSIEEYIEAERPRIEAEAAALVASGERVEAASLLSEFMNEVLARALERADSLRSSLAS